MGSEVGFGAGKGFFALVGGVGGFFLDGVIGGGCSVFAIAVRVREGCLVLLLFPVSWGRGLFGFSTFVFKCVIVT